MGITSAFRCINFFITLKKKRKKFMFGNSYILGIRSWMVFLLNSAKNQEKLSFRPEFVFSLSYKINFADLWSLFMERNTKCKGCHRDTWSRWHNPCYFNTINGTRRKVSEFINFDLKNRNSNLPACFSALTCNFSQFIKIPLLKPMKTRF